MHTVCGMSAPSLSLQVPISATAHTHGCSEAQPPLPSGRAAAGAHPPPGGHLINYNIALSALGKNGAWQAAEQLFNAMPERDAVTHETLTAAYGMAGQARKAEQAFNALLEAGHHPRDYAFTGLIAAHRWE